MKSNRVLSHAGKVLISIIILFGCQGEQKESPTKGNQTIYVSESVFPLMKKEEQKFEELYSQAHIELHSVYAREAIALLFNDSAKMIVSSRPLNTEEREIQKALHLKFGEFEIAIDGTAIIINGKNPVTRLRTTQLDSIFNGTIEKWRDVGGKKLPIEICLPSRNSANYEIVATKILHKGNFSPPSKVVTSSKEMLQFVSLNQNAIGVVGINWLRDNMEDVKVLELSDPEVPDSLGIRGKYFAPYQAYIYRGFYPLARKVYIYTDIDLYGVGTGFISFITSGPGQQIVLDNGLVPTTMPVRLVELTSKGLQ